MGELSKEPARLQVVVEADEADLVSGQLWDLGCLGIEERDEGDTVVLLAGFSSAIAADRAAGSLGRYTVLEELGGGDYLDLWREHATWHGRASGGKGAAREFCRALLEARGEWDALVERYVRERSQP